MMFTVYILQNVAITELQFFACGEFKHASLFYLLHPLCYFFTGDLNVPQVWTSYLHWISCTEVKGDYQIYFSLSSQCTHVGRIIQQTGVLKVSGFPLQKPLAKI